MLRLLGVVFLLGTATGCSLAASLSLRFRLVGPKWTALLVRVSSAVDGSGRRRVRDAVALRDELCSKRAQGREPWVDDLRIAHDRARLGRAGRTDTRARLRAQGEVRQ